MNLKSKRPASLVAILTAAMFTTGCVGGTVDVNSNAGNADSNDRVLRMAHAYEPSHPIEACGIPAMQQSLSGSGITVESYPAAQLGTEAESLEQLTDGSLDIAIAGPSFLAAYYPDAAVLDAPFLFTDVDHFETTVAGDEIGEIWDGLRAESGIDVLASWYYGTRQVTSNEPVRTPDDMDGVKIRVADAPLYLTMAEILGATGTPMALGEVYLSLQQGAIDAQENPIPTIASQNFFEVQDFINLTSHMIQGVMINSSETLLATLSSEEAIALRTASVDARTAVRECVDQQAQNFLTQWEADGLMVVIDDVDRAAFEARALEIIPETFSWGELYLAIKAG